MAKADLISDSRAGKTAVKNFQPKTGIGRFDATYGATQKKLVVTSKLHFQFLTMKEYDRDTGVSTWNTRPDGPAWRHEEKQNYRDAFKTIVERSWSGQYKFVCRKPGWSDLEATVELQVIPDIQRGSSHYWIQVAKAPENEGFRAMVAHDPEWNGRFCNKDVEPEQAKRRDDAYGRFAMQWLNKAIIDTGCDFLPFTTGTKTLTPAALKSLGDFAVKASRYLTQDAVDAGLQVWVYAKTASKEGLVTASGRSKVIADKLKALLSPYGSAIQTVSKYSAQPWIKKPLDENLNRRTTLTDADKSSRSFAGGMLFVKSFMDNSGAVQLDECPSIPRNYVVVAHEFGHVLGLPDEYFGVQCDRYKRAMAQRSDWTPPTKLSTGTDRTVAQQEGFAKLIERSNLSAPIMMGTDTVNDSIMYAGNRILPAHYLTFWQALAKCTKPHLDFDDWAIAADNPRNAIHTLDGF